MVVKRRLLLAVASALALTMAATTPMVASTYVESAPKPLRKDNLLRVKDIAAHGTARVGSNKIPVVALGWRQASNPAQLYLAFSTNGGKDYLRSNGRLRKYRILGDGRFGISVDICAERVWVASAFRNPADKAGDSDVILTTRTIGGGADQRFMTDSSADRKVRDVQVACLSDDLIAVAWLEKSGGATKARLLLRSTEALSKTAAYETTINLEDGAQFKDGIAVTGTKEAVHVAWVRGNKRNMRLVRVPIVDGTPDPGAREISTIAFKDARFPQLAAHSQNVVLAYSDAGKLKLKLSADLGETWGKAKALIGAGSASKPSVAYSADIQGNRVVVEGGANRQGAVTPRRLQSADLGATWSSRDFGHAGARVGALIKLKGKAPLLREAWHNNASTDTLRAQYEKP